MNKPNLIQILPPPVVVRKDQLSAFKSVRAMPPKPVSEPVRGSRSVSFHRPLHSTYDISATTLQLPLLLLPYCYDYCYHCHYHYCHYYHCHYDYCYWQ